MNYLFRNRKIKNVSNASSKTIIIKQEHPDILTTNVLHENQNVPFIKIKQENQNDSTEHYEYVNVKIFFILNVCTSYKSY